MNRRIVIGAFWILISGLCHDLLAQQFAIRKYTAVDGLPQSEVRAIVEDKNGYLWIATQGGGLARFDGRKFRVYTTLDGLLNNIVNTLMIDSHDNIWMAHPRGITKFDGRNFKQFLQPTSDAGARRIRRIFEHGDSVFFVAHPGMLGKIHSDSVHYWSNPIAPEKLVFFTYVKPGRTIVHYLNDSSLVYFNNGRERKISHKNIFNQAKNIFSMGNEIAIKADNGYYLLDMKNNQLVKQDIPITRHIIFYDTLNQVFWTRSENKLFKERVQDGKIESELVYDGAEISQVLADGEGNTWIGSLGDGLIRHFNQDFDKCGSDKMRLVMAIAKDKENGTWIGTSNSGVMRMAKGKVKTYPFASNSTPEIFSVKVSTAGQVFIASRSGLGLYDSKMDQVNWKNRSHGLSSSYISSIEPDSSNGLYVGTVMGGLNYYDGKNFTLIKDEVNLKTKNISALKYMGRSKTLFIGTDLGLSELTSSGKTKNIRLPEFENAAILSLSAYKDSLLLVGSGGAGFAVYNPETKQVRTITPSDGLTSGFVFFVAPDEKDQIWIGTVNGISRMKLNDQLEIIESLHYGFDNGLTGIEANQNSFYLGEKEKYFGLIDGLYQFNDLEPQTLKSLPTHLTGVKILFGQIDAGGYSEGLSGFFKIPNKLSVPHYNNHLTFHFNRVDKRNPKSVQYKYFLENFDKTWSHPTTANEVTYGSLPSGRYTFQVVATNKNGSWESEPLKYTFVVQTPFYQTAWFVSCVVLVLIASILYIIMYRIRSRVAKVMETERIRQKEQESLRKEIARDFHDEMGNQLTRIINYVSLLKLTVGQNGIGTNGNGSSNGNGHAHHENGNGHFNGLGELFNKVEASAKNLYTGTRDFIWAIDPVNDELSQLFIHSRDFGVKLFEEKGIIFRANNTVRESFKLPYGFSREANLIFKEAMTNAFKHSQATNVTLNLGRNGDDFVMELTDDGVGFSYSTITMNGLKNIRGRAERINATLNIEGAPMEGTKVILVFTLRKNTKPKQYVKL
jgi:signal transduction histidine kinase/ligand-binding sensor domain-containing protein